MSISETDLPGHLKALQSDIERMSGHAILWQESKDLDGAMCAFIENDKPVIRFKKYTEAGAAEEMMHLKLQLLGFPKLACQDNLNISRQVATLLDNVLQHHIIYPELEKLGYSPRIDECTSILNQLNKLPPDIDFSRIDREPELHALLAMIYTRGKLDCCLPEVIDKLESLYNQPLIEVARKTGEKIISAVKDLKGKETDVYRQTIDKCLSILKQEHIIKISD